MPTHTTGLGSSPGPCKRNIWLVISARRQECGTYLASSSRTASLAVLIFRLSDKSKHPTANGRELPSSAGMVDPCLALDVDDRRQGRAINSTMCWRVRLGEPGEFPADAVKSKSALGTSRQNSGHGKGQSIRRAGQACLADWDRHVPRPASAIRMAQTLSRQIFISRRKEFASLFRASAAAALASSQLATPSPCAQRLRPTEESG
jgi:hypothetical protein